MSHHAMIDSMKEACVVEIQLEELFKLACVDSPQRWSARAECKRYIPAPWEKHETEEEISADIDGARNWLNTTSDGLIYAISIFFFRDKPAAYPFTDEDIRHRLEVASNTFSTIYPRGY